MSGLPHDIYTSPAVNARSQSPWQHDQNDATANAQYSPPPARPLSGPGTSRQTRRLQLRNAGFRAAALPTRKVTPKSLSSSTNWSNVSGIMSGSDVENTSPSTGARASSVKVEKSRRSSGILQEIGNASTLTRPKRLAKPRVSSGRVFGADSGAGNYDALYTDSPLSPPPPSARNTLRARSIKSRAKVNKTRRSVSGEARMYIDHLEAELASAQAQLQAINSPTVTRQQTSKMRTLNSETKLLQDEIAEWEAKYEARVQEIVDEHFEIESTLRQQIRKLEQDAEETRYKLQELQMELESTSQNMEAVEQANVQLERRLEIMSDLLATSPSKIDLHAATPSIGGRRHQRPKSMLPRFPTASSLVMSPEKIPRTQPPSPLLAFTGGHSAVPDVPDASFSHSDTASDAESVFSEGPTAGAGGSITSLSEHPESSDAMPNFNPWTLHALQSAKARPTRRMRKFGPGSHGPKPLILPSTSQYGQLPPASAPPLERSETTPAFSFPYLMEEDDVETQGDEDSPSSLAAGRRRASTTADLTTLARLEASPFLQLPQPDGVGEESMLSVEQYPQSVETTRTLSSLGSVAGRNLMDELCAVRTNGSVEESPQPSRTTEPSQPEEDAEEDTMLVYGKEVEDGVDVHSVLSADETSEMVANLYISHERSHTRSRSNSVGQPKSAWDRLRMLFSDLWRSPVSLAQHLVQAAQARMRIPEPLRNVQWWLVGVLLGPMARRRMLSTHACCSSSDLERQPLLEAYSPPTTAHAEGLAYGTMYHTPSSSPSRSGQEGRISGKGKKRTSLERTCPHHGSGRTKHSPWVWLKFSITLALAVGVAFKDGPASLLRNTVCGGCRRKSRRMEDVESSREASETPC